MMDIQVQANTRLERRITPPMPMVITLPLSVKVDGGESGALVVYVASEAFGGCSPQLLKEVAVEIAKRLIVSMPAGS